MKKIISTILSRFGKEYNNQKVKNQNAKDALFFTFYFLLCQMYSGVQIVLKYLYYSLTASNGKGHGIHSPFVFDFIKNVLNDKKEYPEYEMIEDLRQELLKDQTLLTIEDLGAGSSVNKSKQRRISSIAKSVVKQKKYSQLLFRIVKRYKPGSILELGTSLGITTSYIAAGNPDAKIITMEGAGEVANIAKQNFTTLKLQNIQLAEGNFENTLPSVVSGLLSVDFAFIDGNHRREPTLNYFQQLLPKTYSDSIFIFDDIHWSKEMEQAWETIKANEAVRCSIDLFFIGIIFFRNEFKGKQNFKIRF
ncbi:MAG: class I SAM-dependent methyltransferase [Bacteroidota bacterium]